LKQGLSALGAFLAVAMATPAAAQDDDDWEVSFTPYLWVAGIKAEIEMPGEGNLEIDRSFSSSLKFAFMGAFTIEHGNLVFFVDGNYLSLQTNSNDIERPTHLDGEVKTELLEATPLVGYKVMNDGDTSVELLAGARIITLKNDIRLNLPGRQLNFDRDRSTAAPVLASRLKTSLGGRWGLSLYGDIGGLTNLDLTWQLFGAVDYRLGDNWSLAAGYRYLSLHSDKERATIDAQFSGPMFGVTYRF